MLDLQLPRPLLNPSRWLPALSALTPLIALDQLRYGGAFAQLRNLRSQTHLGLSVPANFWGREALVEPSFIAVLQSEFESLNPEIEIVTERSLSSNEQSAWRELGVRAGRELNFRTWPGLVVPTLLEWSKELFPETFAEAGEINWHRELKVYETQTSTAIPGIDALRFWPGFLMTRKLSFANFAAFEWARAQALFSPQDDSQLLFGETAVLNPTLHVVTDIPSKSLTAIWRVDGTLASSLMTWEAAAVIDELRETPRVALENLQTEIAKKRFPLKSEKNFVMVIDSMIASGLILRRP